MIVFRAYADGGRAKILSPTRSWCCRIWTLAVRWRTVARRTSSPGVPRRAPGSYCAHLHQLFDYAVKALRDIIVTSAVSGENPRANPQDQKIIFGPGSASGRIPRAQDRTDMLLWPRRVHRARAFSETELLKVEGADTDAPVAAHPGMPRLYMDHADYVGSTSGILEFSKTMPRRYADRRNRDRTSSTRWKRRCRRKNFIGAPGADGNCNCNICPYMALQYAGKSISACATCAPDRDRGGLRRAAKRALDRMLELAAGTMGQGDLGAR